MFIFVFSSGHTNLTDKFNVRRQTATVNTVWNAVRYPHLSIIQVTEASDDLLFVQLVSFELHAPHSLHDAVILQALLPS